MRTLGYQGGCALGSRAKVVDELHEGQLGILRMKSIAQSFVLWPPMDRDLEDKVKNCNSCQSSRPQPTSALLHPWELPEQPYYKSC